MLLLTCQGGIMQCVTPMIRYHWIGEKSKGHILPRSEVGDQLQHNPIALRQYLDGVNAETYKKGSGNIYQTIPCSHCYACRINYAAEWATRIMCEAQYYPPDTCWFVTLTYDENHVKIPKIVYCDENQEFYKNDGTWTGTLEPEEITKFIKRLRDHLNYPKSKYYYCGEYGSGEGQRPHYHLILMGFPLDTSQFYDCHIDKKFFKEHWKSKEIDKLWGKSYQENGSSINDVANLEWNTAAYTARYCMKKVGNDWTEKSYKEIGKIPEFVNMSKNIGEQYYYDHRDEIWKVDNMQVSDYKGEIITVKPPAYYFRKLEKEDPELAKHIKWQRYKIGDKIRRTKQNTSDYTDLEQLVMAAEKIATKAHQLPREI